MLFLIHSRNVAISRAVIARRRQDQLRGIRGLRKAYNITLHLPVLLSEMYIQVVVTGFGRNGTGDFPYFLQEVSNQLKRNLF